MATRETALAGQCGLYEAALEIVAGRAAAALTLPASEQACELVEIRDYVTGVLARGTTAGKGQTCPVIERTAT